MSAYRGRGVNKHRVARLPAPETRSCPVHGTTWRTNWTPSPCRQCEPELYETLFPLRGKSGNGSPDSK